MAECDGQSWVEARFQPLQQYMTCWLYASIGPLSSQLHKRSRDLPDSSGSIYCTTPKPFSARFPQELWHRADFDQGTERHLFFMSLWSPTLRVGWGGQVVLTGPESNMDSGLSD